MEHDRFNLTARLELGERAMLAEDDWIPAYGNWFPGTGVDIIAGSRGLVNLHRCHVCGKEGGH